MAEGVTRTWTAPSVEHDRADLFSAAPEQIDADKHVIATFYVDADPRLTIEQIGVVIAAEQSVGTFTDVSTATELAHKCAARVFSWQYEDGKHSGLIKVAFPLDLFDLDTRGIPDIFTFVTGNWMGFTPIKNCKFMELRLPKQVLRLFKGPKFGVEGLRQLVGTASERRPHIGCTIKPKMGVTDEGAAAQFYEAAVGGSDTFKDDETYLNQWCSPLMDRIAKVYEGLDKAKSEGAHPEGELIYFPQVTTEAHRILELADRMLAHGARGLMLNFFCVGFSALRALAEDPSINVPIHCHRASHAAITRHPRHGFAMKVLGYLVRLAGGDLLHTGTSRGKLGDPSKFREIPEIMQELQSVDIGNIKPVMGVASGGLTPQNFHYSIDLLGRDIQLQNGGGIHGHPWGTRMGARASRQAVDAYMRGIPPEEYARDHPELKAAIDYWGSKYESADAFTATPEELLGTMGERA